MQDFLFDAGYVLPIEVEKSTILGDCRVLSLFGGELLVVPGQFRIINPCRFVSMQFVTASRLVIILLFSGGVPILAGVSSSLKR